MAASGAGFAAIHALYQTVVPGLVALGVIKAAKALYLITAMSPPLWSILLKKSPYTISVPVQKYFQQVLPAATLNALFAKTGTFRNALKPSGTLPPEKRCRPGI